MKMNKIAMIMIGIGVIFLVFVLWFIGSYNGLIKAKADVAESWANVETQYQRRADLIPNLVEVVRKSASFQENTFKEITQLRSQWQGAVQSNDRVTQNQIGQEMGSALSRLLVTVENYPDLDLDTFKTFQAQLEGTENRVSVERSRYNEKVKLYNVRIQRLPTVFVAKLLGYTPEPYFESQPGTEIVPKVEI